MDKITVVDQHCPKCLSPEINMRWRPLLTEEEHQAKIAKMPVDRLWPALEDPHPEDIHLTCRRCQYDWTTLPADHGEPCPRCGKPMFDYEVDPGITIPACSCGP